MTTIPTRTLEDLATPEGIANPFPIFHQLREQSPLQYLLEKPNTIAGRRAPVYTWALLRFDDVHQAVRDHATFSSARPPSAEKAVP
ncbi:MAG: cytochrome P450, partial [Chloroflexota bacterium]